MTEPKTREEKYLNAIANGENINLNPITREEMFLAKAGGQDIKVPTPITRKEIFLSKISGGGSPIEPSAENKFVKLVDGSLTEITEKDLEGATSIRAYAFCQSAVIERVALPNTITSIGEHAFYNCSKLTAITIPDNVTEIPMNAFAQTGITSITIPNGVTVLQKQAFYGCSALTSVKLPNSLDSIGDNAFSSCVSLTSLTIPASVTNINDRALSIGSYADFYNGKGTITFLGTIPPTISSKTFHQSYLEKIIVPKGCGEAYKTATNWANFADYIEEAAE